MLGDHFSPIVGVLGPLYRLWPHIELLLIAQSLLVGCSVFIRAPWIAGAHAMSWGLQGLVNFDFHEVAFAGPASWTRTWRGAGSRARGGRQACCWSRVRRAHVAVFGLLVWRHDRRVGGALCVAGPVATALLLALVVIPHFNPQHVYPYLEHRPPVIGGSTLSLAEPVPSLVWPATKLKTVPPLIPTALLALRSPLILVVPTLVLRFTSADHMYWGTDYHYPTAIVFFALIHAV